MASSVALSNGQLHVGINQFGLVHDFYFPHVGLENHTTGRKITHKIGVFVDGHISWLDTDKDWQIKITLPHNALIGRIVAKNKSIGITLEFDDFVSSKSNIFIRNIHVINSSQQERKVKLFMHQAFIISGRQPSTDTAQLLPNSKAIIHYKGRRAFAVGGDSSKNSFDEHSIGLFGVEGKEGTFKDAEDGHLSGSNVDYGQVDSTIGFELDIEPNGSERVHYWIAAAKTNRQALDIHKSVREFGIHYHLEQTLAWWHNWLAPTIKFSEKLDERFRRKFIQSALIIKSQIDDDGAIMASTDSGFADYTRDGYAYCWPRDAAFSLWPLIRLGYQEEAENFFDFCQRNLHSGGYLEHKYSADGSLGSSWHSYIHDGTVSPPIQEDETSIVLFIFAQYYSMHKTEDLLNKYYTSLVKPMASFLAGFVNPQTGLPKPSYDIWEEQWLSTTYTAATVYAALASATELAELAGDHDSAVNWRLTSEAIAEAAHKWLYNSSRQSFYKGIAVNHDTSQVEFNETIDGSSNYGAFMFGLFDAKGKIMQNAHYSLNKLLKKNNKPEDFGIGRYENDNFAAVNNEGLSNWWIISTLWQAQYEIECGNIEQATKIIDWVSQKTSDSGTLPEQVDPVTGQSLSVSPLAWSQAEYMASLLDLNNK